MATISWAKAKLYKVPVRGLPGMTGPDREIKKKELKKGIGTLRRRLRSTESAIKTEAQKQRPNKRLIERKKKTFTALYRQIIELEKQLDGVIRAKPKKTSNDRPIKGATHKQMKRALAAVKESNPRPGVDPIPAKATPSLQPRHSDTKAKTTIRTSKGISNPRETERELLTEGFLYVAAYDCIYDRVKIGMTGRNTHARIAEWSTGTGIPGRAFSYITLM
jgi:hypothetical protein